MPYGTVKVDNITFDNGGADQNVTASGIYRAITSGVAVSGVISGATLIGNFTVSGATVTGNTVQGTTVQGVSGTFTSLTGTTTTGTTANFVSGVFTTRVSGATITGTTAQFTSGTFVSLTGTTITGTTISGTTISSTTGTFTSLTGTTITGTTVNGTTVNSVTGNFTSLTGVTVTGATANFVSGVFTTQVSGLTITGTQSSFTSGNFVTLSGATATFTSGVIASGIAASPSLSILGDPNTGIYSPGADQVALATAGTGRLFVDASGNVGLVSAPSAFGTRTAIQLNGAVSNWFAGGVNGFTLFSRNLYNDGGNKFIGSSYASNYYQNTSGEHVFEYSSASGTAGAAATMFEAMRITNAGRVGIGTTSPAVPLDVVGQIRTVDSTVDLRLLPLAASNVGIIGTISNHSLSLFTNNTERARIDSSGRLLVGTSSALASAFGTVSPRFQIATTTSGPVSFFSYANDAFAARLDLSKSRGTTVGTNTTVTDGDDLGDIYFNGADGTNFIPAGLIRCEVDGTPGTNDMPGRLVFSTTADGAASPTERMRINAAGNVGIGTTSPNGRLDVVGGTIEFDPGSGADSTRAFNFNIGAINFGKLLIPAGSGGALAIHTGGSGAVSERARIDSSGRLLVGTSSARTAFYGSTITGNILQIEKVDNTGATFVANFNDAFARGFLVLAKSRGATLGSNTAVQSGDNVGEIAFAGADGTQPINLACINAFVDGTPGANDMPGRLIFSTTADGSASLTERMRIDSAGTTTLTSAAATAPFIAKINTAESARIDSSGRLLVGTSSALTTFFGTAVDKLAIAGGAAPQVIGCYVNNQFAARLDFLKSRSGTVNGQTVVQVNDTLGEIYFGGSDGTAPIPAARVHAEVDGTPGTNDMPGRLVFSTTADGSASPTEAFRITNDRVRAYNQAAPATVNTTATITAANLKTGIITSTTAAAVTMTLPTGTDIEAGFSGIYTNMTFEFSVINTGPNALTVGANGNTTVGSLTVATLTSARYALRRTGANAFTLYRLS